jgi:hypothetical protein
MSTLPPGEGFVPPVIPMDCNSAACIGAKAEVDAARTAFTSACGRLKVITSILRFLRPVISANLWYIIVIILVAILLGLFGFFFLALLLWTLIVVYLIAWFLFLVFARVAATLGADLAKHGQEIAAAIARVLASCPAECRGDLSVPACDPNSP